MDWEKEKVIETETDSERDDGVDVLSSVGRFTPGPQPAENNT